MVRIHVAALFLDARGRGVERTRDLDRARERDHHEIENRVLERAFDPRIGKTFKRCKKSNQALRHVSDLRLHSPVHGYSGLTNAYELATTPPQTTGRYSMRSVCRLILWSTVILAGHAISAASQGAEPPVKIIFDTDVDHDCDDIGALYILHGAVERGEALLLATMGCTSSAAIAPCLDAINTWFGRPEIPVGTLKDEGFLDHKGFADDIIRRYPHQHSSGKDYPDAVTLYRQILAQQPDGSVVVLAVGPVRNLANLLKSRPDDASPLDGPALIAKKVKRLEIMGGTYPPTANAKEAEWNFKQDPAAAALVCSTWPTPVLFNGEGGSTNSGRRVTYEMPEHNPLTMAYRLYPGVGFAGDRLSWDPVSTLVAIRGAEPYYKVVSGGTNITDPITGINVWRSEEVRQHAYLVLKARKNEIETALEDMQTLGKGRPTNLKFDTNYYADAGMCQITFQGQRDKQGEWQDQAADSWIQYQHADGRKRLVTSYNVVCNDQHRLPRTLELLGSNDGGASWTRLDLQKSPGFTPQTPRREFAIAGPSKWNAFRLQVTADDKAGVRIAAIELLETIHCRTNVAATSLGERRIVSYPERNPASRRSRASGGKSFSAARLSPRPDNAELIGGESCDTQCHHRAAGRLSARGRLGKQ